MGLFGKLLDNIACWILAKSGLLSLGPGVSEQLKADVLDSIRGSLLRAGMPASAGPAKLVDSEMLGALPTGASCIERWYVECGGRVMPFDIRFTADGRGGTYFDFQLHPTAYPPVPTINGTGPMRLSSEKLGELTNVTAADLERVLADNLFAQFVILFDSEGSFIQAAPKGASSDRPETEPWGVEYRDRTSGKQYQSRADSPLVRRALLSYLRGETEWHGMFAWEDLQR